MDKSGRKSSPPPIRALTGPPTAASGLCPGGPTPEAPTLGLAALWGANERAVPLGPSVLRASLGLRSDRFGGLSTVCSGPLIGPFTGS